MKRCRNSAMQLQYQAAQIYRCNASKIRLDLWQQQYLYVDGYCLCEMSATHRRQCFGNAGAAKYDFVVPFCIEFTVCFVFSESAHRSINPTTGKWRKKWKWKCNITVHVSTTLNDRLPSIIVVKLHEINLKFGKVRKRPRYNKVRKSSKRFEKIRHPHVITTVIGRRSVFLIL